MFGDLNVGRPYFPLPLKHTYKESQDKHTTFPQMKPFNSIDVVSLTRNGKSFPYKTREITFLLCETRRSWQNSVTLSSTFFCFVNNVLSQVSLV